MSVSKEEKPTKQTLITSLLELVSSRTDTDHPLCSECARLLQEVLKERLEDVKKERDGYIAFERKYKTVENGGRKSAEDVDALRQRLADVSAGAVLYSRCSDTDLSLRCSCILPIQLKTKHSESLSSLLKSEEHLADLTTQLCSLDQESADLREQELAFLTEHNSLARKNDELVGLRNSERTQYALELRELERLEGVNVWTEVFCIGVSSAGGPGGRMGNIGGLRLGKGAGGGRTAGGTMVSRLCPSHCLRVG